MLKVVLLLIFVYHVGCVPLESSPESVNVDEDDGGEELNNIRSIITAFFKTSDLIYVDFIVGNLSTLNYTASNVNIRGVAKCVAKKAEINHEALTLYFQWECPQFYISGQYETKGTILILPIEGNGEINVGLGKYNAETKANLVKYKDNNGQSRYKVKSFFIGAVNFFEPITFYATNLFNGDTKLADEALKFLNDNWKDVATVIRGPVMNTAGKQIFKNLNAYLKRMPLENIIN